MPGEDEQERAEEFEAQADEGQDAPGQVPNGDPGPDDAGGDEESRPITRAELRALLAGFGEETRRAVQSMVDKQGSRFDRRLRELTAGNQRALAVAKKAGLAGEQLAAYEQALRQDAFDAALGGDEAAAAAPADATAQRGGGRQEGLDVAEISAQGLALLAELGVGEKDPEMALLIRDGSPEEYFASIRVAGKQKALRLQGQRANPARMPAHGAGGAPAGRNRTRHVTDAGSLFEMAEEDMRKGRPV